MRKILVYPVLLLLAALAACKHNDPATLRLQLSPKWGTADLKLHTPYAVNGGYASFSSFGMYLSHIKLVRTDNTEVEVDSALLLVYNGNSMTVSLSPVAGDYKAIKFGIGLDSAQNTINPANVPANDPVYADNTLYWDGGRKHLFIQIEGNTGANTTNMNSVCFYHIGFDSMYRSATVSKSFSISEGQSFNLNLQADLSQVFNGANGVNVFTDPLTHTSDHPAVAHQVADHFTHIFSIP